MLIITRTFLIPEGLTADDIFFSLFIDDENIITDVLNMADLLYGIQKYMRM